MKSKRVVTGILCLTLAIGCMGILPLLSGAAEAPLKDSGINYAETIDSLKNPERGFYSPSANNLPLEGGVAKNPSANLVHLRFGIQSVSPVKNDGEELLLTDDMIATVNATLDNIRSRGSTAIVRFSYDNFNGYADREPSMEMIVTHINQLSPTFHEYSDVIASIEAGFIGPWGEMHTSAMATSANFSTLISALLAATPDSICITVRRPTFYANWAGIGIANIAENVSVEGTDAYRVGVFNDGYLGSYNDLGTYANREKEVTWLSNQSKHTLFGGEAVLVSGNRDYNNINFISQEMFRTHTSYLNASWNDTLIGYWKNEEVYTGSDELYNGQTAYKYISDHLGYRFSFASCKISESAALDGNFATEISVRNTGCGNVVKQKYAELLFVQNGNTYACDIAIDARDWDSCEISNEAVSVKLPDGLTTGECEVYLRLSNAKSELRSIAFANSEVWNAQLGANRLGSFNITEIPETTTAPETEAPTETTVPVTEAPTETTAPATEAPTETTAPATEAPTETTAPATEAPTQPTAPSGSEDNEKSFWDLIVDFFKRIAELFRSLFN